MSGILQSERVRRIKLIRQVVLTLAWTVFVIFVTVSAIKTDYELEPGAIGILIAGFPVAWLGPPIILRVRYVTIGFLGWLWKWVMEGTSGTRK